jgi:hypothetical protein
LILSRLAKELKAAHWSVLNFELLVIVIGVHAASWLESWGEDWEDSRREAAYLVQLHDELAAADVSATTTGEAAGGPWPSPERC